MTQPMQPSELIAEFKKRISLKHYCTVPMSIALASVEAGDFDVNEKPAKAESVPPVVVKAKSGVVKAKVPGETSVEGE